MKRGQRPFAEKSYGDEDYVRIASAIGVDLSRLRDEFGDRFEAAAGWFRLDRRGKESRKTLPAPSILQRRLAAIERSARRLSRHTAIEKSVLQLLHDLGIEDPSEAYDGPGDSALFDALRSAGPETEEELTETTGRFGELFEVLERCFGAADDLAAWAKVAQIDTIDLGRLTTAKGHSGDQAINGWIEAMAKLYQDITGRPPRMSVAVSRRHEGIATGPFVRFLIEASRPLPFQLDEDALRSRFRTIKKAAKKN